MVPSNLLSSTSMFHGNIQVNDVGEASQEEDDPGVSQDEEAAAGASSQEETEELHWELDL